MGANAAGVGERLVVCRAAAQRAALRCGRAELRHVTARRTAAAAASRDKPTAAVTAAAMRAARNGRRGMSLIETLTPSARARGQALAFAVRVHEQRRVEELPANTGLSDIEDRHPLRIESGIGPVRHPVGAHAAGVTQLGGRICSTSAAGQLPSIRQSASCVSDPPVGRRPTQAVWAAWNWELLTPSCGKLTFGSSPLLAGSGNFDTPWERMQAEKATHPLLRRGRRAVRGSAALRRGRGELRHLTSRRATARSRQQSDAGRREGPQPQFALRANQGAHALDDRSAR